MGVDISGQKVLTNDKINTVEICMMIMSLDIPTLDLTNMKLSDKVLEQLFYDKFRMLREQGLKYPQIYSKYCFIDMA